MGELRPFWGRRLAGRRFTVWNGTQIKPRHGSLEDIAAAIRALAPPGTWIPEWLVKAGEGGWWQTEISDNHALAVSGPEKLAQLFHWGNTIGLRVTPYVVVRGRADRNPLEWRQIGDCARVCGRVVLNLEPRGVINGKEYYWNGPTDPRGVRDQYLSPLLQHAPREALELACIPRDWVFGALGGPETLRTWLEHVGSASWECYDVIAPRDLNPDVAMPRVERCMPSVAGPDFRIIIVQQSRIDAWAGGHWAVPGLQVWHLDGDWDLAPGVWPQKSEKGADPEREPGARPAEAETS